MSTSFKYKTNANSYINYYQLTHANDIHDGEYMVVLFEFDFAFHNGIKDKW